MGLFSPRIEVPKDLTGKAARAYRQGYERGLQFKLTPSLLTSARLAQDKKIEEAWNRGHDDGLEALSKKQG